MTTIQTINVGSAPNDGTGDPLRDALVKVNSNFSALNGGKQEVAGALTNLLALVFAANKLPYATGADTWALADLTAFARSLLDDADVSSALTTLGVSTFIKTLLDDADAATARTTLGAAALASPSFTGTPTASTATTGTNTTQLATTAFVQAAIAAVINSAPGALDTLDELAAAMGDDANFAATVTTALAGKQASHANLTALAGLTLIADRLPYADGTGTLNLATFTAFARTMLDDANAGAVLTTLGVSAFIQTLLDDSDGATARTTLGLVAATAAEIWAATDTVKQITSAGLRSATASQALTDGATITPNFNAARNFHVTLAGNRTLANPTNQAAGQNGRILVKQDATGSRTLAYGANWKFAGGTPTLSTAANAVDMIVYDVQASGEIYASLVKGFA